MAFMTGGSATAAAVQMPSVAVEQSTAQQSIEVAPVSDVQLLAVPAVAETSSQTSVVTAAASSSSLSRFWASKSYPYPGYSGGNSPAGYVKGQCFDYAVWAWHHWTDTKFDHVRVADFKSKAKSRGYVVSTKPKQGALAIWKTKNRNHAAYVISYKKGAKSFTVREVRWNYVGPHNRSIKVSDINRAQRAPNFFIYAK